MTMTRIIKMHDVLFLKKVVALKRASCEWLKWCSYCCLARSARVHFLRPGFLASDYVPGELAESCVLVLLTFRLAHSMRHNERCEVRASV